MGVATGQVNYQHWVFPTASSRGQPTVSRGDGPRAPTHPMPPASPKPCLWSHLPGSCSQEQKPAETEDSHEASSTSYGRRASDHARERAASQQRAQHCLFPAPHHTRGSRGQEQLSRASAAGSNESQAVLPAAGSRDPVSLQGGQLLDGHTHLLGHLLKLLLLAAGLLGLQVKSRQGCDHASRQATGRGVHRSQVAPPRPARGTRFRDCP